MRITKEEELPLVYVLIPLATAITTLEGIEAAVRGHVLGHVSPEIGNFLLQQQAVQAVGEVGNSKASLDKSASVKPKQKSFKSKHGHN